MKLIIMRHGECVGLDKAIINGWRDFELTSNGKKQAKDVAKKLKQIAKIEKIDKAYSSYLIRTIDTAKNIVEEFGHISVKQDIRLNERHYGFFQGMVREEAYKYPEYNTLSTSADRLDNRLIPISEDEYEKQIEEYAIKLAVSKDALYGVLPRSESILDVQERVIEFLKENILIKANKDDTILMVGHANTVKLTVGHIEKLSFDEITKLRFGTCGMTIYDMEYINGEYVIKDILHLNDEYNM